MIIRTSLFFIVVLIPVGILQFSYILYIDLYYLLFILFIAYYRRTHVYLSNILMPIYWEHLDPP